MTDSIIWRATNGNLTAGGASAANIVRFNEGSVNQNGYIYKSEFDVRISVPENERISEDLNAIQDMGMDGIDITLTGMIEESDSETTNPKFVNLMTWLKRQKQTVILLLVNLGYIYLIFHISTANQKTQEPLNMAT